jgi:hypothetical protein
MQPQLGSLCRLGGLSLKTIGLILAALILIPAAWLGSVVVYEAWNTYTHRFRLTLEVDTPEGVKSGSSVIEVAVWQKADWFPQTGGFGSRVRGEAVFVDLGNSRNVIAVLGLGPTASKVDLHYLAGEAFSRSFPRWYFEAPNWVGRAELRGELIPTLITFSDLNNPKTARVVRPQELPQVFGNGFKLRSAFVEMTSDPVTHKIEEQLPWWSAPGRPASIARRAWLASETAGPTVGPETLFVRR